MKFPKKKLTEKTLYFIKIILEHFFHWVRSFHLLKIFTRYCLSGLSFIQIFADFFTRKKEKEKKKKLIISKTTEQFSPEKDRK